jgi:energy-coupling factor transporter ATP-binding protein EcfA2
MIRHVHALGFRSLEHVERPLARFQILVGPNASGKSTFLGALDLLGRLVDTPRDIASPLRDFAPDFRDLTFMRRGQGFELVIEAPIPDRMRALKDNGERNGPEAVRYEIALAEETPAGSVEVTSESLWLRGAEGIGGREAIAQRTLFPEPPSPPDHIVLAAGRHAPRGWRKVISKTASNDYFKSETTNWSAPFNFGRNRLALANLPEDEMRFPVAVWFRRLLSWGIQRLSLSSEALRRPSPPGSPTEFLPDGSNLPWVVHRFRGENREAFARWVAHVQTALSDVTDIDTIEREDDRHRYLRLTYRTGLKAPSWTVSDGTLRLLALTLVPYLGLRDRIYLVEEPENGIHPQAVETVFQALAATDESQILCATHSPVFLSLARPEQVLCFARTHAGATDIVRGDEHPKLRAWRAETDLGTVFAAGILG